MPVTGISGFVRIRKKSAGWLISALKVPEVKEKLVIQGLYPAGTCGAEFAALVRKQYEDYGHVIREANIKGE